jgi:hypothetical protein
MDRTTTPDNLWEVLDYSLEDDYSISEIIANQAVTSKIIQQILQTANISYAIFDVCTHPLAQVKDIVDVLHRINNPSAKLNEDDIEIHDAIVYNAIYTKRAQLNTYMQEVYNLDTKDITTKQLQEILNINYLDNNYK